MTQTITPPTPPIPVTTLTDRVRRLTKAQRLVGAGLFGMLVHSVFDFNLHLPSHAIVFLLLSMVISHLGATVHEPVKAEIASMSGAPHLFREASS